VKLNMSEENLPEVTVVTLYQDIKAKVDSVGHDVGKNARGVAAAGPRMRKVLRQVRKDIQNLVKLSIVQQKASEQEKSETEEAVGVK
jgi:hypothetical protein